MLNGHSNGSGPETRLIRGEVVIEQEFDADGQPGRWRHMAITVPMYAGGGITSSVTMSFDLPDGRAADAAAPDTWAEVVQQMGGSLPGGRDEG